MSEKQPKAGLSESTIVRMVAGCAIAAATLLAWRYWREPSVFDSGRWGQLGDYFGGMLNPIVAFAALLMLARSVKIQRTELAEARQALIGQADSARSSVEIAGYTAAINSVVAQIQIHQTNIDFLLKQIGAGIVGVGIVSREGQGLTRQGAYDAITDLSGKIDELTKEQDYFSTRLKLALRLSGHSQI